MDPTKNIIKYSKIFELGTYSLETDFVATPVLDDFSLCYVFTLRNSGEIRNHVHGATFFKDDIKSCIVATVNMYLKTRGINDHIDETSIEIK